MLDIKSVEWENLEGLGDELLEEMRPAAIDVMIRIGVLGTNELKKTLTGKRSGRVYTVSRTGALHVASAPGEPPAVLFGNLRNSMGYSRPRWRGLIIEIEIGSALGQGSSGGRDVSDAYARRLEYGGTDSRGVYIAPRPYMDPTFERVDPRIDEMVRRFL